MTIRLCFEPKTYIGFIHSFTPTSMEDNIKKLSLPSVISNPLKRIASGTCVTDDVHMYLDLKSGSFKVYNINNKLIAPIRGEEVTLEISSNAYGKEQTLS